MWKRGKCSRSNSCTRQPCWARRVEVVAPAGPPPMTTTCELKPSAELCRDMNRLSFVLLPNESQPVTVRPLVGPAGGAEQVGQGGELGPAQVAELAPVARPHLGVEPGEQGQAALGDADL